MEIWFREDVARILAATLASMEGTLGAVEAEGGWRAEAYERGFGDALRAVGIAFGVVEPRGRVVGRRAGVVGEVPIPIVVGSEEKLERR